MIWGWYLPITNFFIPLALAILIGYFIYKKTKNDLLSATIGIAFVWLYSSCIFLISGIRYLH